MKRYTFGAGLAVLVLSAAGLYGGGQVAQAATEIETFFRNGVFHIRNNSNRRVMCQVSAMVSRAGYGTQGLENYQRAVVIFPRSEEAPFTGPVGNPRVFDCKYMER